MGPKSLLALQDLGPRPFLCSAVPEGDERTSEVKNRDSGEPGWKGAVCPEIKLEKNVYIIIFQIQPVFPDAS